MAINIEFESTWKLEKPIGFVPVVVKDYISTAYGGTSDSNQLISNVKMAVDEYYTFLKDNNADFDYMSMMVVSWSLIGIFLLCLAYVGMTNGEGMNMQAETLNKFKIRWKKLLWFCIIILLAPAIAGSYFYGKIYDKYNISINKDINTL